MGPAHLCNIYIAFGCYFFGPFICGFPSPIFWVHFSLGALASKTSFWCYYLLQEIKKSR